MGLVMMHCILAFTMVVSVMTYTPHLDSDWLAYKNKYNKAYAEDEENIRRDIWEDNGEMVAAHNRLADRGESSFRLEMNQFADMTSEEFTSKRNGLQPQSNVQASTCTPYNPPNVSVESLPTTVDWRTNGYVTKVKDQGECGSCWAFATTGTLEGQHFKKTGKLTSLSESNLVDCSWDQGNYGCEGGLMDRAFAYIIQNKGIDDELFYPYKPEARFFCHFLRVAVGATMTGCLDIARGSEHDLQIAVAEEGPIAVAIDASVPSFQLYKGGVYNEPNCTSNLLDHGVLVVGYGVENGSDYWLVKNSWGTDWGEAGYIKMSRNKNNQCGTASTASFPVV